MTAWVWQAMARAYAALPGSLGDERCGCGPPCRPACDPSDCDECGEWDVALARECNACVEREREAIARGDYL